MAYPFVKAFYDYGSRANYATRGFVVHMAEGGGTVSYLSHETPRGVSVHFVIEKTGRIVQMLRLDRISGSINPHLLRAGDDADGFYGISHVKAVLGNYWTNPNVATITCEIEGYAKDGPNLAQHRSLAALYADMRSHYPSIKALRHRDFQDYKACPGHKINWSLVGGHAGIPIVVEEDMKTFTTYPDPRIATVKDTAWLYDNDRFATSSENVQITGGNRTLPYLGKFTNGSNQITHIVGYQKPGATTVTARALFVKDTDIVSVAKYLGTNDPTSNDAEIRAAIATEIESLATKVRNG